LAGEKNEKNRGWLHSLARGYRLPKRWLRKSNLIKDSKDPIQATIMLKVACHHASQYPSNGIREYSEWFPGAANNVADAHSRDDDRSDEELIQILHSIYHSHLPKHFKILLQPNKITSCLTLMLLWLLLKQQLMEANSRTKLGHGDDTQSTVNLAAWETTSSSTEFHEMRRLNSRELLPWLCAKRNFQDLVMLPRLKAQSAVSSTLGL
jgi:hypothetical protein